MTSDKGPITLHFISFFLKLHQSQYSCESVESSPKRCIQGTLHYKGYASTICISLRIKIKRNQFFSVWCRKVVLWLVRSAVQSGAAICKSCSRCPPSSQNENRRLSADMRFTNTTKWSHGGDVDLQGTCPETAGRPRR